MEQCGYATSRAFADFMGDSFNDCLVKFIEEFRSGWYRGWSDIIPVGIDASRTDARYGDIKVKEVRDEA
jgi:hypothetical protein